MKLLFDQNLSPKLVQRLAKEFPDSAHVSTLGLDRSTDAEVWNFAREYGYTIVTQDVDYSDLSVIAGFPPGVVLIRRGNCPTGEIEMLLRTRHEDIEWLKDDSRARLLILL